MIILLCPGQGSQTPGFLEPWIADSTGFKTLSELSELSDIDLIEHGTRSDAETIRNTAIAQPLIVASGMLALQALWKHPASAHICGIAGHSVGEFTAAYGAKILNATDTMKLVTVRGRAMQQASDASQTGMSAVLGGTIEDLTEALARYSLHAANQNGAGQVVVAGDIQNLADFKQNPPAKARVMPLSVAGAFHTPYMKSAQTVLREVAQTVLAQHPTITVWTNRDGSVISDGVAFRDLLVEQMTASVRWDLCMESFAAAGVTGLIELVPGGTLTKLAKRALPNIPYVALQTPDDLPAAYDLLDTTLSNHPVAHSEPASTARSGSHNHSGETP